MIETGATYTNPRSGGRATVLESWRDNGGERFRFERVLPPGTGKAAAHYHLDYEQRFEIVAGTATMLVDGERRTLSGGESIELTRGARHADPWNEAAGELTTRMQIAPVPKFIESYVETWVERFTQGRLNAQDELPFLQLLVIAQATDSQSFAAQPPRAIQRATAPLLAAIGRLRGYRA